MGKHYVPQRYLRRFAVPGDESLIWMYDKVARRWSDRPVAINKVAQERDYYPDDVEKQLTTLVERPGNNAIETFCSRSHFRPEHRSALSVYMAVMTMRGPRKRRESAERFPEVLESTMARLRSEAEEAAGEVDAGALARFLAELDRLEEKYREGIPDPIAEQVRSPWPSAAVVAAVERMTWRFVPAPAGDFYLTSDNPAFYFGAYGLGSPKAELTFPVSADLALLGSHQGPPGSTLLVTPRPALVREINRRTATGAERFIFTGYREWWIEVVANKKYPYLSRIAW